MIQTITGILKRSKMIFNQTNCTHKRESWKEWFVIDVSYLPDYWIWRNNWLILGGKTWYYHLRITDPIQYCIRKYWFAPIVPFVWLFYRTKYLWWDLAFFFARRGLLNLKEGGLCPVNWFRLIKFNKLITK